MSDYIADPKRIGLGPTGIYVPARIDDRWDRFDIAELDRDSLHRWLRSRGGENRFAEGVVLMLLGHPPRDMHAEDIPS